MYEVKATLPPLGDHDGRTGPKGKFSLGLVHGLPQHVSLHGLAFAVQRIEARGDVFRLGAVLCHQQPGTQAGITDAASGVDARPKQKPQVPGRRRPILSRHPGERGQTRVPLLAHDLQAPRDEGAVDPRQRHHVTDRAEGHQIQPVHEIGSWPLIAEVFTLPQLPVDRHQREENDANGT